MFMIGCSCPSLALRQGRTFCFVLFRQQKPQ
nr:MAG TPA: hypothetical protein [Caudoviricetes sp.]DAS10710.1 MAG TPA: hypothetical protein [Caudoviricetes sp.]